LEEHFLQLRPIDEMEGRFEMSFARWIVATLALVVAFVLGVWAGPYLRDRPVQRAERAIAGAKDTAKDAAGAVGTKGMRRAEKGDREASATPVATISASEPDVLKQLKPIMNLGTKMDIAAEGFRDAEQFATVAHAAHNTKIPFMVLKHRVLEEKKSLATAIEEYKPELDGAAEAKQAREAARKDIAEVRTERQADGQVAVR
jgi:hypothetical protein